MTRARLDLPGHTCPDIDAVKRAIRKHVPEDERKALLERMESIRTANTKLRAAVVLLLEERPG